MNCLAFLEKEIHSVIMATVDDRGLPVTCAVDIMDSDNNGLYFLTAKGKGFYHRLVKQGYSIYDRYFCFYVGRYDYGGVFRGKRSH